MFLDLQTDADVDGSRDHIVGALAHVDVIIGMHRIAQLLGGEMGDHFIGIHVGAGARTGLEHINGKLIVMFAVGDLFRTLLDGGCDLSIK